MPVVFRRATADRETDPEDRTGPSGAFETLAVVGTVPLVL